MVEDIHQPKLREDTRNANRGTVRGLGMVERSLQQYGAGRSILASSDGIILAGNKTYSRAIDLGIPVQEIESDGETLFVIRRTDLAYDDPRAKELAIADNRASETGLEWSPEALSALADDGVDLSQFWFEDELSDLLADATPDDGLTDPDDVPAMPEEPTTKRGDIWQLGKHRLMCGNATVVTDVDKLMDGKKADMVFTDPPYGMNLDTDYSKIKGSAKSPKAKGYTWDAVLGDSEGFDPSYWLEYFGYCKEQFWWGADYYFECLPRGGSLIVWQKRDKADAQMIGNDFEICWSKTKHKKSTFWKRWVGFDSVESGERRVHPTQKPIDLCSWVLESHGSASDTVVDLFGGSGTTMIACEQTKRSCYMMELAPQYCDVIVQRWEQFTGDTAVLEAHAQAED